MVVGTLRGRRQITSSYEWWVDCVKGLGKVFGMSLLVRFNGQVLVRSERLSLANHGKVCLEVSKGLAAYEGVHCSLYAL